MDDTSHPVAHGSRYDGQTSRINDLSRQARLCWIVLLVLLGLLAFLGLPLLGVEDTDFFGFGRRTELPLIGLGIPTASFFWAAPVIIAALHIHLHLSWIKLCDAAARVRSDGGAPPDAANSAWLVSDWTGARRGGPPARRSPRPIGSPILFAAVWLAVPIVLIALWWRSMPKHDLPLTFWTGSLLVLCIYAGAASWRLCRVRLRGGAPASPRDHTIALLRRTAMGLLVAAAAVVSLERVGTTALFEFIPLAEARMDGARLAVKPSDWLDHEPARSDFKAAFDQRRRAESREPTPLDHLYAWDRRRASDLMRVRSPGLRRANLRAARLRRAFLVGADLRGANLEGADLREARLEAANLAGARMDGANLEQARLEYADLVEAHLEEANLQWARMYRANLHSAQLTGARLNWAHLEQTRLERAQLERAQFSSAIMQRTTLTNANLERANFMYARIEGAHLSRANLKDANFGYARMEGARLPSANLEGARFTSAHLTGAAFDHADLQGASFWQAQLEGANFYYADLEEAEFRSARMRTANLQRAHLRSANLERADLEGADLSHADLEGADLRMAKLDGANLNGANLRDAVLRDADLSGATNLTRDQLDEAIGEIYTPLPEGMSTPPSWR